ncbi:FAD-dependent monooxygenase [Mobilicoccus massiliensis]|uniref:FAD-dependent monooxygenase n=1 Tax=Mobilicoccus massiliensis TaxID=1522310 RepID=UPI00058B66EE|nr:FAD-dependent monooxygenase [Mobilicoccus massiliensis]
MKTRVAIVGGSIAGLTLAALLDPDRFDVTLHEERPERREAGSALGLWPAAWRVLDAVGAGDRARAFAAEPTSGALRDGTGRPLIAARDLPMTLVLRPDLIDLLEAVVPDSVRRVDERVDDPVDLPADLVVGADGVRSAVRRSAFGEHLRPRLTPWLALRGILPGPPPENGEYWGRGDLAGVVEAPRDSTYWFTTHVSTLGSLPGSAGGDPWRRSVEVDVGEALAEARRVFGGRPDRAAAVQDVLARATPESVLAQRIYETPRMHRLVHGRAVLIGDSAHAMTPNLGRGACEAMIDAHVLAGELSRRPLTSALARYEARRLPPARVLPPVSRALMRLALSEALQPTRDRALAGVGRLVPA